LGQQRAKAGPDTETEGHEVEPDRITTAGKHDVGKRRRKLRCMRRKTTEHSEMQCEVKRKGACCGKMAKEVLEVEGWGKQCCESTSSFLDISLQRFSFLQLALLFAIFFRLFLQFSIEEEEQKKRIVGEQKSEKGERNYNSGVRGVCMISASERSCDWTAARSSTWSTADVRCCKGASGEAKRGRDRPERERRK
jgi:hypothetical protein